MSLNSGVTSCYSAIVISLMPPSEESPFLMDMLLTILILIIIQAAFK